MLTGGARHPRALRQSLLYDPGGGRTWETLQEFKNTCFNCLVHQDETVLLFSCLLSFKTYQKKPRRRMPSGLRGGGYLLFHFRSIIGVARFNFSVRNGKRWSPRAIATLVSFVHHIGVV